MYKVGLAVWSVCAASAPGLAAQEPAAEKTPPAASSEDAATRLEDCLSVVRAVTVSPGETVQDVVCFFCNVVVQGTVRGDAVSLWGGIHADGEIAGDAVAVGGAIRVAPGGSIGKEVVALGGPVEAPPGALAEEPAAILGLHFPGQRQVFAIPALVFLATHLLLALGAGLLLGERRLLHIGAAGRMRPGRTLLVGLLFVSLWVTAISVAGVIGSGVETATSIAGGIALAGAFALGLPVVALGAGRRLRRGLSWRPAVLAGALVIALASLVPLLGVVVSAFLWCAVCGLAVRAVTLRRAASRGQGSNPSDDVLRYYALGLEKGRLDEDFFPLERARTQELILRHLPPAPGVVLDVGGAAGAYALWLAERGYEVHLVDPSPLHIQQAEESSREREAAHLASARVGDARKLELSDASANAVLLLGPLYHLTEEDDRRRALDEARRVLQPGGWLFAAAISRFASLVDGLRGALFEDEAFARIVEADLADGQHRNETGNPFYFTTAFFHHPGELSAEVREAGFTVAGLYAVEGPGAFVPGFAERWKDPKSRDRLLDLLRRIEREPALLGVSPHLLAVGQKPRVRFTEDGTKGDEKL
jgi:ubiquinone/menaquinone biosynthesis C-methylase UbiE